MLSLLQNARQCKWEPYPHIIIENALPEKIYQELWETRPTAKEIIGKLKTSENQRVDLPTRRTLNLKLSPVWRDFITYHTSREFFSELMEIFGDYASDNVNCGVRGAGKFDINMECQPGINTPLTQTASVRGPHLDNPVELYGGMFYMRDPLDNSTGGELEIYKLVKKPKYYGKLEIEQDCVELVDKVPYKANTLVMFMNGETSVHGVSPRSPTTVTRNLVNLIGEVDKPLFKVGHNKY